MGDSKLLQGATLLPAHGRAGDRKHRGVFQGPEKTGECSKDFPQQLSHLLFLSVSHLGQIILKCVHLQKKT